MMFRGFYSDEQGGFRPLRAPPSVSKRKLKTIQNVLFISKNMVTARSCALDLMVCARSLGMRSITVRSSVAHEIERT